MPSSVALMALDNLPVCLSWISISLLLSPSPAKVGDSKVWLRESQEPTLPGQVQACRHRGPSSFPATGGQSSPGARGQRKMGDPHRAIQYQPLDSPRLGQRRRGRQRVCACHAKSSNHVSEMRGSGGVSAGTSPSGALCDCRFLSPVAP